MRHCPFGHLNASSRREHALLIVTCSSHQRRHALFYMAKEKQECHPLRMSLEPDTLWQEFLALTAQRDKERTLLFEEATDLNVEELLIEGLNDAEASWEGLAEGLEDGGDTAG